MLRRRIDKNLLEATFRYKTDDNAVESLVRNMKDQLGTLIYQAELGPEEYGPPLIIENAVMTDTHTRRSFWTRRHYVYRSQITTPRAKTITCADSLRVIQSILQLEHPGVAKARLDALLEDREVYLIMGYSTSVDPRIEVSNEQQSSLVEMDTSARAQALPVYGVDGPGLPVTVAGVSTPEIGGSWSKSNTTTNELEGGKTIVTDTSRGGTDGSWSNSNTTTNQLEGEYIWTVQYRPVRFTVAVGAENYIFGEPIWLSNLGATADS
ncbi:uncharacterized protein PAC_14447 [Phialocephala subalpina]|uniref:Uncharacterized protein n=1 Tax=Phialocephala subalpina TaxID=576137 RepID=A0A1L7XHM7_9HELO|nr:uncharacterized protein PAC_14447 [Phialocephala subalpina]